MTVISLSEKREENEPHIVGEAVCLSCKHNWIAVAPTGTFKELECPNCEAMKGVLKYGILPEVVWECECGCFLFVISGVNHEIICRQCGRVQLWG